MKDISYFKNVPDATMQLVQSLASSQPNPYSDGRYDSIQIGSGDTVFNVNPSGMWIGNARYALAPFRIDMDGNGVMRLLDKNGNTIISDIGLESTTNFENAQVTKTNDQTFTGTTWQTVVGLTHSYNDQERTRNILLFSSISGYHDDTDQRLEFRYLINSVQVGGIFCVNRVAAAGSIQTATGIVIGQIPAGDSVIDIQARSSNANSGYVKGASITCYSQIVLLGR